MVQSRVPKGTPRTGGQFAESRKPSGGDLTEDNARCPECGKRLKVEQHMGMTRRGCGACGFSDQTGGEHSDDPLRD